jgi:PAS domain S-box-containing protein
VPIVLVFALALVGFFIAREHGERDARHESAHRAEIAATRVRDRVTQAATLVDGVRRFLAGHDSTGVNTEQFTDIGARWLGPVGLPAAAWAEQRGSNLPATLVTGSPPMSTKGIDLGGIPGIAAAVASPQTAYRVTATPLEQLPDGTSGLFLVQSAQRVDGGNVEPGYVVLFIPASWLLAAATDKVGSTPAVGRTPQISVGGASTGNLGGAATAASTFAAAGQPFAVRVPLGAVQGDAKALPWIILAAGLVLAAFAGALGVSAARRTRAKAEVDRLFTISPDLIVVAGFDGYFKRVNPAFEELLGHTTEEALARPYLEFVHPEDRERTTALRDELHHGDTEYAFENRFVCADGTHRWIEWTATPVVDEQLMYAVGRDVTERRQAEIDLREAEERTRALAEEQAALRRVATLVARGVPSDELFAAVTEEVGQLLPVTSAAMGRYDPDGMFTTVAAWSTATVAFPVGRRWIAEGKNVTTIVVETGGPARIDDFTDASGAVGVVARAAGYRSAVGTPIIVEGRMWGVMSAASSIGQLPADTEARLANFTELVATAIANAESRVGLARLAEEQAALRRVATLVAEGVSTTKVVSALCEEVSMLLAAEATLIGRLEPDGTVAVVAISGTASDQSVLGTTFDPDGDTVLAMVLETGHSARKDDYRNAAEPARRLGIRSGVGVPIIVEGALWGIVAIGTVRERFADDTEQRLREFTQLAATAIANAESRAALGRLADEQAALRRVATLVAHGVQPAELFSAVSEEVAGLFGSGAAVLRYDHDAAAIVFIGAADVNIPIGTRWEFQDGMASAEVYRTRRSARADSVDWSVGDGPVAATARRVGVLSTVASPIVVEGRLWGAMSISSPDQLLPADTEERLEKFTELIATAIANAESKSEVAASRARIVAASDEARRRIERDLHDGTQQRLVSLSLELRLAEVTVSTEVEETRMTLGRVADELVGVIEELREISRGIHPAILSEGGLGPALRTLARRSPVPVQLFGVIDQRLPEAIEVAAYYVVSEALANATKHANASRVDIEAAARDCSLSLSIRDDGIGGADPEGSGLLGLRDRVEALGGSIEIVSPLGRGTLVAVQLRLDVGLPADESTKPGRPEVQQVAQSQRQPTA